VQLSRGWARFLIGIAIWNVVTWSVFVKNLWFNGPRTYPTGYYVAHTVLIVVNLAIAVVLGPVGWQALRGARKR
jgi:hypothetical protein